MILALKTDNPVTELYVLDDNGSILKQTVWESGNLLSEQLLSTSVSLLQQLDAELSDIDGLVVYQGPGSFTGLRIGLMVANTIAYAQHIPIAGASGTDWIVDGLSTLANMEPGNQVLPEYGKEANITKPRK